MSITNAFSIESMPMSVTAATGRVPSDCCRRFAILFSALLILLAMGCKGQRNQDSQESAAVPGAAAASVSESAQADEQAAVAKPEGAGIALDATPKEVAEAALKAIGTNDKAALRSLVAVKKVKQDIEAITHGRSTFQGMVDKAVPLAVSAIMSEINALDAEGREIDQETITGTTALITVKGKRAGQEQTRRLFLVQEDNQWRLVPSHR